MKKINLTILAITIHLILHPQATTLSNEENFPPPLQVGLSVGINYTNVKQYEYYIDQRNNTLERDEIDGTSFVGSVLIAYTPLFTFKNVTTGNYFKSPGPVSILGSFNLGQLNTSTGFNTKFSGGLGLGANIQNVMIIGVMVDFTMVPVLRESYAANLGQQIVVNKIPIVTLDESNKTYFRNAFVKSVSLKFIYNISRRSGDAKSGFGTEKGLKYKLLE